MAHPHPALKWLPAPWFIEYTGGGCDALMRSTADGGYILITRPFDPSAPEEEGEPCVAGRYDAKGEPMWDDVVSFPSVSAALAALTEEA